MDSLLFSRRAAISGGDSLPPHTIRTLCACRTLDQVCLFLPMSRGLISSFVLSPLRRGYAWYFYSPRYFITGFFPIICMSKITCTSALFQLRVTHTCDLLWDVRLRPDTVSAKSAIVMCSPSRRVTQGCAAYAPEQGAGESLPLNLVPGHEDYAASHISTTNPHFRVLHNADQAHFTYRVRSDRDTITSDRSDVQR